MSNAASQHDNERGQDNFTSFDAWGSAEISYPDAAFDWAGLLTTEISRPLSPHIPSPPLCTNIKSLLQDQWFIPYSDEAMTQALEKASRTQSIA